MTRVPGTRYVARRCFATDGKLCWAVWDTEEEHYVQAGETPYPPVFYRSPESARHLAARLNNGQSLTSALADVAAMHAKPGVI